MWESEPILEGVTSFQIQRYFSQIVEASQVHHPGKLGVLKSEPGKFSFSAPEFWRTLRSSLIQILNVDLELRTSRRVARLLSLVSIEKF
jgi:hypothetical protein